MLLYYFTYLKHFQEGFVDVLCDWKTGSSNWNKKFGKRETKLNFHKGSLVSGSKPFFIIQRNGALLIFSLFS